MYITKLKDKNEGLALTLSDIIAEKARKLCIEKDIIKDDSTYLTGEDLSKIIKLFGGELKIRKEHNDFLNEEEGFKVYCDSEDKDYTLNVLTGLGIAFFYMDKMKDNDKIENFPENYDDYFMMNVTSMFARGFLMPRSTFESTVIKYSDSGKCNVTGVAKQYKISVFDVLTRGEELHNWS